jgi:hypothetical protein
MLQFDPRKRPTAVELLAHRYFNPNDFRSNEASPDLSRPISKLTLDDSKNSSTITSPVYNSLFNSPVISPSTKEDFIVTKKRKLEPVKSA